MIRHTGGTAVGEISTRSSPFCLAMASACGGGMMPSCLPSSSITRISRTLIRSLTRTRSSRRGPDLSKAIKPPKLCPQSRSGQLLKHSSGIFGMSVGNWQHDDLQRRQPQRERAGIVLDQHGDKALEAAEDGPMNHHGTMFGVVGAYIFQIEALRHLKIELNRCALPFAADGIGHVEVDFGTIKCAGAFIDGVLFADSLERAFQLRLGVVPCRGLP